MLCMLCDASPVCFSLYLICRCRSTLAYAFIVGATFEDPAHAQMDRTAIRGAVYARKKYILDNLE